MISHGLINVLLLTFYEAEIDPFRSVGLYKLLHPIRYQSKKNSQFYLIESGNLSGN